MAGRRKKGREEVEDRKKVELIGEMKLKVARKRPRSRFPYGHVLSRMATPGFTKPIIDRKICIKYHNITAV